MQSGGCHCQQDFFCLFSFFGGWVPVECGPPWVGNCPVIWNLLPKGCNEPEIFKFLAFSSFLSFAFSSLSQAKHWLILRLKLRAPNSSLCYNSALLPTLSICLTQTPILKETFECYHFYIFVQVHALSVFFKIILESVFYQKIKHRLGIFKKSVKNEPVCGFPPQSLQSV